MIINLTEDKINDVKNLLDEYTSFLEQEYKLKKSDALNLIMNNIKDENNTYYVYIDDSTPLGLVGGRKEQSLETEAYITRIFVSEKTTDGSIEIKLFEKVFRELSSKYNTIRIMGYQPSTNLKKILNDYSFQPFDRYFMSISRETVENLPEPGLPDEYCFDTWNEELKDVGIEIMTEAHIGSVDNIIFSFFRNHTTGMAFMQNLENHRWGKFKPINTSILKHEDTPIGVCFMTVLNQGNGYIPDFVLKTDYKGRGLGKKLFIKSLKWFLEKEPNSEAIDLDVTKKNTIAFNIYKTIGFSVQRTYSVYTWNKD
ncbi:MAG: GNAT family N-acetyltransferase [Candidatus Heimdallarchaeota archaeon]|nr:MAG: GNAT family N-acetyltransferase [Candidatus Heimdallarchaeota archaeon]